MSMDDLRYYIGTAKYTSNFTVPDELPSPVIIGGTKINPPNYTKVGINQYEGCTLWCAGNSDGSNADVIIQGSVSA